MGGRRQVLFLSSRREVEVPQMVLRSCFCARCKPASCHAVTLSRGEISEST
jgi:hypothetical protein